MSDLDAPARLVFWPDLDGSEDAEFPTLREALAQLGGDRETTPWIITTSGKILRPREIEALRHQLQT